MNKSAGTWFLMLAGLFLASRMVLILWGIESVWHYEELEQGYIAVEFLSGLRAPLLNYQADAYTGGTLLTGLMAIPFFQIFGPTLFSLKMLALSISFISFSVMYLLMNRLYGVKTAILSALLWIFAAPLLTRTSLMALGSHERILPGLLILFFLVQYARSSKRSTLWLSCLALSWGVGVSISYINLIAILASLLTLLTIRKPLRKPAELLIPALSFAAGLSLWFLYNYFHHWAGIDFLAHSSALEIYDSPVIYAKYLLHEFRRFFIYLWPNSFSFPGIFNLQGKFLSYFSFILLLLFIFSDWIRNRRAEDSVLKAKDPLKTFCRIYLILFPVFHCFSRYKVYTVEFNPFHYRYFISLYVFTLLYFTAVIAHSRFRKPVVVFLIMIGMMSQFQAAYGKPFGTVFTQPGFKSGLRYYIWWHPPFPKFKNLAAFETEAVKRLSEPPSVETARFFIKVANQENFWTLGPPEEIAKTISKIPRNTLRRYFFRRWGAQLDVEYKLKDLKLISSVGRTVPAAYQRDFYLGAARQLNFAAWANIQDVETFIQDPAIPEKELFYLTWGASLFRLVRNGYEPKDRFQKQMDFVNNLDTSKKVWVYRGLGIPIYRSFRYREILALNMDFLKKYVPEAYLSEPYWGVGWFLARRYFRAPKTAMGKIKDLEPAQIPHACEGFKTFHQSDPESMKAAEGIC